MNNQVLTQLTSVLNTLTLIETKGNNTLLMAECLKALNEVCQVMAAEQQPVQEEVPLMPNIEKVEE